MAGVLIGTALEADKRDWEAVHCGDFVSDMSESGGKDWKDRTENSLDNNGLPSDQALKSE